MTTSKIIPALVLLLAIAGLALFVNSLSHVEIARREPGADRTGKSTSPTTPSGPALGELAVSDVEPSDIKGSWPEFRGGNSDNISVSESGLNTDWGDDGPPILWTIRVGEGHAGAAIHNGRMYLMDYDRALKRDALRCMSLETAKDIWRFSYPLKVKRNHGMSRTVPAVTDEFVVAIGPKCHVLCLESTTGKMLWHLDLVKDFGTKEPPWYAGQCPIIREGKAIIAPTGKDLVIAVDCRSGDIVWRTPNPRSWRMTHTSLGPMTLDGKDTLVLSASGGVAGLDADTGELLWDTDAWTVKIAAIATPVDVGDGKLFLSGGYNAGAMMLQVSKKDGAYVAEPLFSLDAKVFGSEQHTPVFFENHIYGTRPDGEFVCLDLAGKVVWSSGGQQRFGKGLEPYMIADGMAVVMSNKQILTLASIGSSGFKPLASHKVLKGHDAWGPIAVAGGLMIVRDLTTMRCLDLRKK